MTTDEAIQILLEHQKLHKHEHDEKECYDNIALAIDTVVEALSKPSLPSNLDEAAEKYSQTRNPYGKKAFKAGAEWMAEQGVTCNGEIVMDFSDPDDIYARRLSADYWKELGPALMKIEPGEVIIQIRKK